MVYALTWLPTVLEAAGVKVAEVPDWRTRGRAEMGQVRGVMIHHTAGAPAGNMPSLGVLQRGRPDLEGPLAHLGLGRDGTYYVIAAGRCNHAGPGRWSGIETGNGSFVGIEAENTGRPDDRWPDVQMTALVHGVAALLGHIGADAGMACGHKEFALPLGRKSDPLFAMPAFREAVRAVMTGRAPALVAIPAIDGSARPTLRRGASGGIVRVLQTALGSGADGFFGPRTEALVRQFQRDHDLVPDGIVGPHSWAQLDRGHPEPARPAQTRPSVPVSGASPPPPASEPTPARSRPAIPDVDDQQLHPVTLSGSRVLTPSGKPFASRYRLGFVTTGLTSARDFVAGDAEAARGLSESAVRVVCAVTANEGKLEAINSWDGAFLSIGILQWTLGVGNSPGELPGLLALVRQTSSEAFDDCYGRHGIGLAIRQNATVGYLTLSGQRLDRAEAKATFRSGSWAYRFWRASHHSTVRRSQIALAIDRIARFADGALRGRRMREWLSSELAMAMLLDEHVNRPAHVPGTLDHALGHLLATGALASDPTTWGKNEERRLLESYVALRDATNMTNPHKRASALFDAVNRGELSDERGSFR